MSSPLGKGTRRSVQKAQPADIPTSTAAPTSPPIKDAVVLLHSAARHLETTMRLLAEATLLQSSLDDSLGLEAQRLIGVRAAVQAEIQSLEKQRLRDIR